MFLQKARLISVRSAEETIDRWLTASPLTLVSLTYSDAILARPIEFLHEDLADRFIAATSHRLGAELATDDAKLLSLDWLKTVGP